MHSIIKLEDTPCRLIGAHDLATINIERSLSPIIDECHVIPCIGFSTLEGTVNLTTITELNVQIVVRWIRITKAHIDLRACSPSSKDGLVIDVKPIDIDTSFDRESTKFYRGNTTGYSSIVLAIVGTKDWSTCRSDCLDSIDIGISTLKYWSTCSGGLELKGHSKLLTRIHLLLAQGFKCNLYWIRKDCTSLDYNLRGRQHNLISR